MKKSELITIDSPDFNLSEEEYKYQDELTTELDSFVGDFDQNLINKIVLWKINRYAKLDEETIKLLNGILSTDKEIDKEKTITVLSALLNIPGIGIPMASTILRFRNPNIYQIIDQRAYRILYGEELKLSATKTAENIETYLYYLERLKAFCISSGKDFSKSDRFLYEKDKKLNKELRIRY
ncbi:MAG TPA: hypothetical protein PKX60_04460 [Prolixibacteraceae bacterium]|nr:hypothetical protein [Prolixibacteraceae bacterium]